MLICSDDEAALLLHYFGSRLSFSTFLVLSKENLHFLEMVSWELLRCCVLSVRLLSQDSWGLGNLWPEKHHRISVTSNELMPQRQDKFKRCD